MLPFYTEKNWVYTLKSFDIVQQLRNKTSSFRSYFLIEYKAVL